MSTYSALKDALRVYSNHETMGQQALESAVVSLSEWGIWSNRFIARVTGLNRTAVTAIARKPERTGGRFVPEAIEPTMRLLSQRLNGSVDETLVAEVIALGVSTSYLSKLTGIPQRTVARMAGKK